MFWDQGDGSGLRAIDSAVGRVGQLACWEHYLPLARYGLIADSEQIHSAMYPGSIFGPVVAEQTKPTSVATPWLRGVRGGMARCRSAGPGHERYGLCHRN